MTVNGVTVSKADLAEAAGCDPKDKCWSVVFSAKPWPLKLGLCNHKGEEGHESEASSKHTFTKLQMAKCRTLVKRAAY